MYFVVDGSVYKERSDGKYVNVEIVGKDKVVEIRELESITVNEGEAVLDSVGAAIPCSLDTIIQKFNLTEANPIPFTPKPKKPVKKAAKKPAKTEPDEDF